jgi:hypothetical protein
MWIPPAYSPIEPAGLARALVATRATVGELESRLREWYGAERAVATASGTHALQLALRAALEQGPGPARIALPAYSCYDLVSAAVWVGAPVVFYDLDPRTLAPEPESLARATGSAGVLVVGNLLGFPLDWSCIRDVAAARGLVVVEDAAQGLGAEWRGEAAGTLGDLSVLSFARGKGWTGGRGGAVLARRGLGKTLPEALPGDSSSRLTDLAAAGAIWLLARPSLYGIPARVPGLALGETHYHPPTQPAATPPWAAAMVLASRDRSLEEVALRRARASVLRETVRDRWPQALLPLPVAGGRSGDLRMPLLIPGGAGASHRHGIYAGYPRPLPELEAMRPLQEDGGSFPGAARLSRELLTAPTHSRTGRALKPTVTAGLARLAPPA